MVPGLSAPAAGHVLHNDGGVSWNMLLKNENNRPGPHVSRASGCCTSHDRDSLTFVEGGLGERGVGETNLSQHHPYEQSRRAYNPNLTCLHLRPPWSIKPLFQPRQIGQFHVSIPDQNSARRKGTGADDFLQEFYDLRLSGDLLDRLVLRFRH